MRRLPAYRAADAAGRRLHGNDRIQNGSVSVLCSSGRVEAIRDSGRSRHEEQMYVLFSLARRAYIGA